MVFKAMSILLLHALYFLQIAHLDAGKHFEDKNSNNDLSHASLIENEKLMLFTSLEDSSGTVK